MNDAAQGQPAPPPVAAAEADRSARRAAIALALALPGDTLLYLLLPLFPAAFGVTLAEAGILLAANRLIRIAGYGWVARLYADRAARTACVLAVAGSVLSTLSYATLSGLWPLLAGRLLWGLSFAALNIANHALATSPLEGAARRAGRARAIIAMGPTASLVGGAALSLYVGPRYVFLVLALAACAALPFAFALPDRREAVMRLGPRFERPGPISLWAFASGLTLDGLFVFGLGLLAAASFPTGAVMAAGLAMALRYGTEIVFSTAGGSVAARFGARPALVAMSLGAAAALALLAGSGVVLWTGVLAAVVLRALSQPLLGPLVAEAFPGPARISALARRATWRDIGAGTGPLLAGVLLSTAPAALVYPCAGLILAGASLLLLRAAAPPQAPPS